MKISMPVLPFTQILLHCAQAIATQAEPSVPRAAIRLPSGEPPRAAMGSERSRTHSAGRSGAFITDQRQWRQSIHSGQAAPEPRVQRLAVQVASDKDQLTLALQFILPGAIGLALEEHVNTLEHKAIGLSLDIEDALHAEDVLTLGLEQLAEPGIEFFGIQFTALFDAHAGDGLVVGVSVTMAAVLVNMSRLNSLTLPLHAPFELLQPMLSKEGVIAVGRNAQRRRNTVLTQDQFIERLTRLNHSTHANRRSDATKDSFGNFFSMMQRIVQPTPALLAVTVIVTVIMTVVVLRVIVAVVILRMTASISMAFASMVLRSGPKSLMEFSPYIYHHRTTRLIYW